MRVRFEHWSLLLDMAEKSPQILTNKFNGAAEKARGNALWQTLAQQLNGLGFGEKSIEEWRRALTDWKSKTKAKAAKLRMEHEGTGGGPPSVSPLSDIEKRLISLIGTVAVSGDKGVEEIGLGRSNVEVVQDFTSEIVVEQENILPISDHSYIKKEKSKGFIKKTKRVRENQNIRISKELLEMNKDTLRLLSNINDNIESIADSLKIIAQNIKK